MYLSKLRSYDMFSWAIKYTIFLFIKSLNKIWFISEIPKINRHSTLHHCPSLPIVSQLHRRKHRRPYFHWSLNKRRVGSTNPTTNTPPPTSTESGHQKNCRKKELRLHVQEPKASAWRRRRRPQHHGCPDASRSTDPAAPDASSPKSLPTYYLCKRTRTFSLWALCRWTPHCELLPPTIHPQRDRKIPNHDAANVCVYCIGTNTFIESVEAL